MKRPDCHCINPDVSAPNASLHPHVKWRVEIPERGEIWELDESEKREIAGILNTYLDKPGRIVITVLR